MESSFSAFNLRRLFRALDTDNNRLISHEELSTALQAMRLIRTGEEVIVAHLVAEMDSNRSGMIKEEEFLSVFRGLTPAGLAQWLDEIRERLRTTSPASASASSKGKPSNKRWARRPRSTAKAGPIVTVTEFGREFDSGKFARLRRMAAAEAIAWLRARQLRISSAQRQPQPREDTGEAGTRLPAVAAPLARLESARQAHADDASAASPAASGEAPSSEEPLSACWVDVQGLDVSLLQDLGDVLGYGVETAKDAAVYQRAKAEVVLGTATDLHDRELQTAAVSGTPLKPVDHHHTHDDDDAIEPGTVLGPESTPLASPLAAPSAPDPRLLRQLSAMVSKTRPERFQCLLHRIWLRSGTQPFRAAVHHPAAPGSRSRANLPSRPGSEFVLHSRRELASRPPELLLSQVSVIVVDEWTVLTVRGAGDSSAGRRGEADEESSSLLSGRVAAGRGCCSCLCGACDDAADTWCGGADSRGCCGRSQPARGDEEGGGSMGEGEASGSCGAGCRGEGQSRASASRRGRRGRGGDDSVPGGAPVTASSSSSPSPRFTADVAAAEVSWSAALKRAGDTHPDDPASQGARSAAAAERQNLLTGLGVFSRVASRLERGGAGVSTGGAAALLGYEPEAAAGDGAGSADTVATLLGCGAAKSVSLELVDAVLDQCYQVRDVIKDWQEAVEASLTAPGTVPLPMHTAHMFSLSKVSELYQGSLRPLLDDLSTKRVRRFFDSQGPELGDTVDDLSTMLSDVSSTIAITARLQELYSSLSNDMMNRALFVLTITTTTIMPLQVFSGVFGMNFAIMPELSWEYSYAVFWIVSLLLCAAIFVWFISKGYFALYVQGAAPAVQADSESRHRSADRQE
jgi:hypothetical protein